jgi:hypothetical protein
MIRSLFGEEENHPVHARAMPAPWRTQLQRVLVVTVLALACFGTFTPEAHATSGRDRDSGSRWFWVQSQLAWKHVYCNHVGHGIHLDVYSAATTPVRPSEVSRLITTFDRHIFPTDTATFGMPSHLGRIDLVLTPLDGLTLGYFDENDLMRPGDLTADPIHSNHANVLYVRSPSLMPDADRLRDVEDGVAHELQHLINYRIRVLDQHRGPQQDWLNEGLSFYAQAVNGYWTPRDRVKVQAAAASPSWPVTALEESSSFLQKHGRTAYGRSGLFIAFLGARFGSEFIRRLVGGGSVGMAGVSEQLNAQARRTTLADVFADWGVAGLLDEPGRFGYGSLSALFRGPPTLAIPPISSVSFDSGTNRGGIALQAWGQAYLRFLFGPRTGDVRISLSARANHVRAALVLQDSERVNARQVLWVHFDSAGRGTVDVPNAGQLYDQASLVLGDVWSGGGDVTDVVRVQSRSIHTRYNNSLANVMNPTRLSPSAIHAPVGG